MWHCLGDSLTLPPHVTGEWGASFSPQPPRSVRGQRWPAETGCHRAGVRGARPSREAEPQVRRWREERTAKQEGRSRAGTARQDPGTAGRDGGQVRRAGTAPHTSRPGTGWRGVRSERRAGGRADFGPRFQSIPDVCFLGRQGIDKKTLSCDRCRDWSLAGSHSRKITDVQSTPLPTCPSTVLGRPVSVRPAARPTSRGRCRGVAQRAGAIAESWAALAFSGPVRAPLLFPDPRPDHLGSC